MPFFPPLEPLQSKNLHAAILRCLTSLKKEGVLGKDFFFRNNIFDDCKGQKLQEVLWRLSCAVLRKRITVDRPEEQGIVARLCGHQLSSLEEKKLGPPLVLAHQASLTRLLKRRKSLCSKYSDFSSKLTQENVLLDQKFVDILKQQAFLDQHVASDVHSLRVAKAFNTHWYCNNGLKSIILHGYKPQTGTELADRDFNDIWSQLQDGAFEGNAVEQRRGELEDLEERVQVQSRRLQKWISLRDEIARSKKLGPVPSWKNHGSTGATSPDRITTGTINHDWELVFSPRKSPRKSIVPDDASMKPSQSQHQRVQASHHNQYPNFPSLESCLRGENCSPHPSPILIIGPRGGTDENNSEHDVALMGARGAPPYCAAKVEALEPHKQGLRNHGENRELKALTPPPINPFDKAKSPLASGNSLHQDVADDALSTSESSGEAHPLLQTPSPGKHKTTLLERTRHSMSLMTNQRDKQAAAVRAGNLYKRSELIPYKTPLRDLQSIESTPFQDSSYLEQGYESVFKSRPKVFLSPPTSPSPNF